MGYDEYYKGQEYKGANEHLLLKFEILNNSENVFFDENKTVNEDNESLRKDQPTETGKHKKKSIKQSKKNSNIDTNSSPNSVNTITTQTAGSNIISTTSAVTAGVVVVATISIIMAAPPLINLLNFNVGGDYLEYKIETSDFQDGIKYFVEISGEDDFFYKKEIQTTGLFEEIVNNLTPNSYYTYKFVGYDSALDSKVYLEKNFSTKHNYLAKYNKCSVEESQVMWTYIYNEETDDYDEIYRIIIPTRFENETTTNYQYRVTLFNDEGLNEIYQGNISEVVFEIPRIYQTAALKYESIKIENDKEIICDTLITDTYTFEPSFKINDFVIDYYNSSAILDIELDAPENYGLRYYTSLDATPKEIYSSDTTYVDFPSEETNYYFYMVDDLGNQASETIEYTYRPIEEYQYEFEYSNPTNITVTYNDNGSINAYLDTKFNSEDPEVYYEIKLITHEYGSISYTSRNRYAAIENFMNYSGRSVTYKVFKLIDGIKYCYHVTSTSGTMTTTPEMNFEHSMDFSSDPPILNFQVYNNYKLDTSSAYLILNDNERLDIPQEAFTSDNYYDYILNIEMPHETEKAQLHFMGSRLYNDYDILKEIEELKMKGNCYTKVVIDL